MIFDNFIFNGTLTFLNNDTVISKSNRPSIYFYTIFTPFIFFFGLIGNSVCIKISISGRVRKQTSSLYFASLSICDILVLLFYVLPEWIDIGLGEIVDTTYNLHLRAHNGLCQLLLYVFYTLRFLSVWLLVASAIERYIGVCHPLLRLRYCSRAFAQRVIASIVVTSMILCLYKPLLSAVSVSKNMQKHCTSRSDAILQSYILDTLYAGMLSVIPSIIIMIVSVLIARRLLIFRHFVNSLSHKEMMGVQFASFLVLISSGLLLFTWPYYVCWIRHWYLTSWSSSRSSSDLLNSALDITKSIFYCNYSMNFFLYSLATFYFRSEMKRVFSPRSNQRLVCKTIADINELDLNLMNCQIRLHEQSNASNRTVCAVAPNYQQVHQNHALCSERLPHMRLQTMKTIQYN